MTGSRRINVFYKSNGKCILEKNWESEGTSRTGRRGNGQQSISSETLWPLIQVFVQFAREVQGGTVKRLVFRNPEEYTTSVQRFEPAPREKKHKKPVIVHVAHDEIFVVAVTELLEKDCTNPGLINEEQAAGITIAEFCESVLDHLNREQTSFVATLTGEDYELQRSESNRTNQSGSTHDVSSGSAELGQGSSLSTHSEQSHSGGAAAGADNHQPVVQVNKQRLLEYISKTQNLLSS